MVEPSASVAEMRALLHVEQRKLAAVRELARALGARLDMEHVLGTVLNKVPELLDAERATLYLLQQGPAGAELVSKIILGGLGPSVDGPGGALPSAADPAVGEIRLAVGEGIAGSVALSGAPLNIADAYAEPRFNPDVDRRTGFVTRSILCVPVPNHEGHLTGVLQALNRRDQAPFDADDETLLGAVAAYAGIALENAKLYQSLVQQNAELLRTQHDLQRHISELDLLYQIERESSAAQELSDLLASLCKRAAQLLSGEIGVIALRLPQGELDLTFYQVPGPAPDGRPPDSSSSRPPEVQHAVLPPEQSPSQGGLLWWVVRHDQPLCQNDAAADPLVESLRQALGGEIRQVVIMPLHHAEAAHVDDGGSQVLGAIAVVNKTPACVPDGASSFGSAQRDQERSPAPSFDAADQRLLTLLSGHAARAIILSRTRDLRTRESHLSSIGHMLAGIMHDLRSPMTIVSGYAQLMAGSEDPAERDRYSQMIRKQLGLMEAMTGEVMAFARGDRRLLVRRVLLNRFLDEVREQLQSEMGPIRLVIDARYLGPAYFDELKMLRLFHNLARNAAQAMPDGGEFRILVDSRDGELRFTFTDTGAGIPHEIQGHLFETFVSAGKDGGTGLGLAIVKKIVKDHHGRISVTTGNEGTSFRVAIPLSPPPETAEKIDSAQQ